jgi:hypothetical protein
MRRIAALVALSAVACGSPAPDCACTLSSGVTLACGRSVCIDGQGTTCSGGIASADPSACASGVDGGGVDAAMPPSDASSDAPIAPSCTSPLITRTGTTATLNTPMPGSCDGDVAVNCAENMAPGRGRELRIACASTEECRTFTMDVYVAPSTTSAELTHVGSYTGTRCVPAGATPVTYTFHAGVWSTTTPRTCDGMDRVSPVSIGELADTMQPENFSSDPSATAVAVYGSPDGYVTHHPCDAGQHCVQSGESLSCIDDGAVACTASRCAGNTLIACRNGFEVAPHDCTSDGQTCFTSSAVTGVVCSGMGENAASCRPPGTLPCQASTTSNACDGARRSYTYCDYDSCAELTNTCDASQTCYGGNCITTSRFCDPTTTVASCAGTVAHTCGSTGYRGDDDCSTWGMACATETDASVPGGVRAGCVATTTPSPDPCAFPAYCASNTLVECCSSGGLFNAPGASSGVACLPHHALAIACGAADICAAHSFGPTCDPR